MLLHIVAPLFVDVVLLTTCSNAPRPAVDPASTQRFITLPVMRKLLPRAALQVRSGKDAMPPFQGSLSDEEIAAVAAFVYDQAAKDLW